MSEGLHTQEVSRDTRLLPKCAAIVVRDLQLLVRRPGQMLQILGFFVVVTVLFPLGYSPELGKLRLIAPGVLWVGALLASLLALEGLFRDDAEDGTLEQWLLCGQPLAALLLAKTAVHWLLTGLPLTVLAPLLAVTLGIEAIEDRCVGWHSFITVERGILMNAISSAACACAHEKLGEQGHAF